MFEREDVGQVPDILNANCGNGWTYSHDDDVHIFIKCADLKRAPHIRIRKDSGQITCLNGVNFHIGKDTPIGWTMSSQDFINLVTAKEGMRETINH